MELNHCNGKYFGITGNDRPFDCAIICMDSILVIKYSSMLTMSGENIHPIKFNSISSNENLLHHIPRMSSDDAYISHVTSPVVSVLP